MAFVSLSSVLCLLSSRGRPHWHFGRCLLFPLYLSALAWRVSLTAAVLAARLSAPVVSSALPACRSPSVAPCKLLGPQMPQGPPPAGPGPPITSARAQLGKPNRLREGNQWVDGPEWRRPTARGKGRAMNRNRWDRAPAAPPLPALQKSSGASDLCAAPPLACPKELPPLILTTSDDAPHRVDYSHFEAPLKAAARIRFPNSTAESASARKRRQPLPALARFAPPPNPLTGEPSAAFASLPASPPLPLWAKPSERLAARCRARQSTAAVGTTVPAADGDASPEPGRSQGQSSSARRHRRSFGASRLHALAPRPPATRLQAAQLPSCAACTKYFSAAAAARTAAAVLLSLCKCGALLPIALAPVHLLNAAVAATIRTVATAPPPGQHSKHGSSYGSRFKATSIRCLLALQGLWIVFCLSTWTVSFAPLLGAAVIADWLTARARSDFQDFFAQWWAAGACRILASKPQLVGAANWTAAAAAAAERGKGVMVAANHSSPWDIFLLLGFLPGKVKFLSKVQVFKIPIIGTAMRLAGHISIGRGDRRSQLAALREVAKFLEAGTSVVVFPEGTRSIDGRFGAVKSGTIRMAQRAGAAVVPVALSNTFFQWPRYSILPLGLPRNMKMEILPAIATDDKSLPALTQAVAAAIQSGLPLYQQPKEAGADASDGTGSAGSSRGAAVAPPASDHRPARPTNCGDPTSPGAAPNVFASDSQQA
eukprot:GHVT01024861.1.p1 GENE.GHVT01024861.1~~GHVT01024861.1.p1  ORF type:complete len:712 (+),score=145.89 GHVT01024861.1:1503-3638(+)